MSKFQIITFYEFKALAPEELPSVRDALRTAMCEHAIKGTVILAEEGFNSTVCGTPNDIRRFVAAASSILDSPITHKTSFHSSMPFRRIDVKIKPEIVTLKRAVELSNGIGTHVDAETWNELISDPETIVLDARNDYEFRTGTFQRAINPSIDKFSDLPGFVEDELDPKKHKRIAMFCTGGIRCEKLAPFMKQLGFAEVYQLRGGILRYLEETPPGRSLWQGECFVFDDRVSVDSSLSKGSSDDLSQESEY
jgi:UPF0176 protein